MININMKKYFVRTTNNYKDSVTDSTYFDSLKITKREAKDSNKFFVEMGQHAYKKATVFEIIVKVKEVKQ